MPDLILPSGEVADAITLNLDLAGSHGVFDFEKTETHPFPVTLTLHTIGSVAGHTDDLADTINYAEVADKVKALIEGPSLNLIETLAEKVAEIGLASGAVAVDVTVGKPEVPIDYASNVSVSIRRLGPLLTAPAPVADVVIALGSNLGDPVSNVATAAGRLAKILYREKISRTMVTKPLPSEYGDQPNFVNAVMTGATSLSPLALLAEMHRIENIAGRVRTHHWGPRTLDLDLISYRVAGVELTSDHPKLRLPHPEAHKRDFVIEPWKTIDPGATLGGTPISQL